LVGLAESLLRSKSPLAPVQQDLAQGLHHEMLRMSNLVANLLDMARLLLDVWGPSHAESSHYLHVYIRHLRQKLEDDPAQPRYLLTETAIGYRLFLAA
jgi:signal transduction histidine kinase